MGLVYAISMFKDEVDVAAGVVRHLADEGVDGILIADNMSTDGTKDALWAVADELQDVCRVLIVDDDEVGYYQSRKMTSLAHQAASYGAEWIIPFDADEIWYSPEDRLGLVLRNTHSVDVVMAPLFNHFCSRIDDDDPDPFRRLAYRQKDPGVLPKVAFRYHPSVHIEQGNHGVSFDWDAPQRSQRGILELRHFPYRSFEHFKRKAINGAAAYAATDLSPDMGAHWRQYARILELEGEDVLREEVFNRYYNFLAPIEEGMIHDPAPYMRWSR